MNYLREIRLSELPKSYAGRIPAVRYLFEVGGLKFLCAGSREDRSADTASMPELAVGCVYDAVYVHFGDTLFLNA